MNNLRYLLTLPLVFFIAAVNSQQTIDDEIKSVLAKKGLPLPDAGIQIVPRSKLGVPESLKQINESKNQEMKVKGYVLEDNPQAKYLLEFKHTSKIQLKKYAKNHDPASSHLRTKLSYLSLAFQFKGLNESNSTKVLGYAPIGSFHDNGWSGAVQFFEQKNLGSCSYAFSDLSISHGSIMVADDSVRYDVNSKITLIDVSGSNTSGYVYKIDWFDDEGVHKLECANMNYSSTLTNKTVALAKQIDLIS